MSKESVITLRQPHEQQKAFIESSAKRRVIRAGRRSGKTVGVAVFAVKKFLEGRRILYATPTEDQIATFWYEIKRALANPIDDGLFKKNETLHAIELEKTKQRIRAKTAYNADTLRGDYADLLILDEWQLMSEDAWGTVGVPMLLDNNGDAIFIYTPPSARTMSTSKARDKMHAAKLFKKAAADTTGRWATFHFSSHDNPYLSREALDEIVHDMTERSYQQEIMAEDLEDTPGALWTREMLEALRVSRVPILTRIVIAIDPSVTSGIESDEAGIIAAGLGEDRHGYVIEDASLRGSPAQWAMAAVSLYNKYHATDLVAESNQGGEMVRLTIATINGAPPVKLIHASEGKVARAQPVVAQYAPVDNGGKPLPGKVHHVGFFPELEDELCNWLPGMKSPNRLDALVYALTTIMIGSLTWVRKPGREFKQNDDDTVATFGSQTWVHKSRR